MDKNILSFPKILLVSTLFIIVAFGSVVGLSPTTTLLQNSTGFITFAGAATATVTFAVPESDANYLVFFDCGVNQTTWPTNKLPTGFTANSSNPTSSATCGWVLVRSATALIAARVLTVNSSNPATGVSIVVSPADNSGNTNGATSFTRTYNDGTVVSLIAPASAGGNTFSKWQKDGVDYAATLATTVTMNAAHTMTAVFGTPPPTSQDIVYVSFSQPDSVTTLPNADTGQVTTVLGTVTFGTSQYQARNVRASALDTGNGAVWDAGIADGLAEVQVLQAARTQGFILRATDVNNHIRVRVWDNRYDAAKVVAGVGTTIATGTFSGFIGEGDYLQAALNGSTITITLRSPVNNRVIPVVTVTETFNQTATKHGIYIDNLAVRLKHFSFRNSTLPTTDWIFIKKPANYQTRQRDGANLADIPISGTYSGTPTVIEARWNGAAWQTITTNPAGGVFSGTLIAQAAGQGLLEVRFANNINASDRRRYVGIGDVFLVAGQSNAEGRITNPQFYSHATLRVGVYGNIGDCEASPAYCNWREAYDPTDDNSSGIGSGGVPSSGQDSVWPLLATKIMAQTGFPVAFITSGAGQSGLFGDGGTWQPGAVTYLRARHAVEAANPGGLKGVLWYQGESDSRGEPGTQASYEDALKSLRASLSTDLGFGALKMFVAQLSTLQATGITRSTLDLIRIAQTNVGVTDANMFVGPILYDLDTCTGGLADCVHISTPAHAQKEADRWWHMMKNVLYGGTEGRGPRFSSLTRISATQIDVAFTLSGMATLMTAVPPTTGWRINDSTSCTVTAAVRQSNTVVRLTVSGCTVTSGVTTVSWGSFNDAAGQVLTDNSTDAMSAEPFVNKLVP